MAQNCKQNQIIKYSPPQVLLTVKAYPAIQMSHSPGPAIKQASQNGAQATTLQQTYIIPAAVRHRGFNKSRSKSF